MKLYRVLRDLSSGERKGDIVDGGLFKHLDALLKANALSPVSYPPLSELPGWTTRAEVVSSLGIITIEDFINAEDEALRKAFNHKTQRTIAKWRDELRAWLVPVSETKRRP